jgi:hypothetical protein
MKILDPIILRQTMRGYTEVNQITEIERFAWLRKVTDKEAQEFFDHKCQFENAWRRYQEED